MMELVKADPSDSEVGFTTRLRLGEVTIVILCDGRSVHAYTADRKGSTGATWLFNVAPAPKEPEWLQREAGPFMNPAAFSRPFDLGESVHQVLFDAMRFEIEGRSVWAILYDDHLIGRVWVGADPGDSVFAVSPSPLAGVLPPDAFD